MADSNEDPDFDVDDQYTMEPGPPTGDSPYESESEFSGSDEAGEFEPGPPIDGGDPETAAPKTVSRNEPVSRNENGIGKFLKWAAIAIALILMLGLSAVAARVIIPPGQGPKGEKGDPGLSLAGPKGDKGDKGDDGRDGKDGRDGNDGKDGLNGKDGKDGLNGKDGKEGPKGKDGVNGKDGPKGADGKNGKDGKDGSPGRDGRNGRDGSGASPSQRNIDDLSPPELVDAIRQIGNFSKISIAKKDATEAPKPEANPATVALEVEKQYAIELVARTTVVAFLGLFTAEESAELLRLMKDSGLEQFELQPVQRIVEQHIPESALHGLSSTLEYSHLLRWCLEKVSMPQQTTSAATVAPGPWWLAIAFSALPDDVEKNDVEKTAEADGDATKQSVSEVPSLFVAKIKVNKVQDSLLKFRASLKADEAAKIDEVEKELEGLLDDATRELERLGASVAKSESLSARFSILASPLVRQLARVRADVELLKSYRQVVRLHPELLDHPAAALLTPKDVATAMKRLGLPGALGAKLAPAAISPLLNKNDHAPYAAAWELAKTEYDSLKKFVDSGEIDTAGSSIRLSIASLEISLAALNQYRLSSPPPWITEITAEFAQTNPKERLDELNPTKQKGLAEENKGRYIKVYESVAAAVNSVQSLIEQHSDEPSISAAEFSSSYARMTAIRSGLTTLEILASQKPSTTPSTTPTELKLNPLKLREALGQISIRWEGLLKEFQAYQFDAPQAVQITDQLSAIFKLLDKAVEVGPQLALDVQAQLMIVSNSMAVVEHGFLTDRLQKRGNVVTTVEIQNYLDALQIEIRLTAISKTGVDVKLLDAAVAALAQIKAIMKAAANGVVNRADLTIVKINLDLIRDILIRLESAKNNSGNGNGNAYVYIDPCDICPVPRYLANSICCLRHEMICGTTVTTALPASPTLSQDQIRKEIEVAVQHAIQSANFVTPDKLDTAVAAVATRVIASLGAQRPSGGDSLPPVDKLPSIATPKGGWTIADLPNLMQNGREAFQGKGDRPYEAVGYFRSAVEVAPRNAVAHYWLAVALHRVGSVKEATEMARAGAELERSKSNETISRDLERVQGPLRIWLQSFRPKQQ